MVTPSPPARPPLRRARRRRVVTGLVAVVAVLATAAGPPGAPPVGAAPTDGDTVVYVPVDGTDRYDLLHAGVRSRATHPGGEIPLEGHFTDGPGTDVFVYTPGAGPDGIVDVAPDGTGVTTSFVPKTVWGTYTPLVGDFDGNGLSDIFWYAPGSSADSLWLFSPTGAHTVRPSTVSGDYVPTVMDTDGDGIDDIVWYAPGRAADSIWRFRARGYHLTKAIRIDGDYWLVPGTFGLRPEGTPRQRLLFFAPDGYDSIWTFDPSADHTSAPAPALDGGYYPIVGRFTDPTTDAVLWYRPGAASEALWGFTAAGTAQPRPAPQVHGDYDHPAAVGDVDANGYQDIAWSGGGGATTLWRFDASGPHSALVGTDIDGVAVMSHSDPADLDPVGG